MKTIYIFVSEMDNSTMICNSDNFDTFNQNKNRTINVSQHLQIKPWELVGQFEFQREQTADKFELFLKTKDGLEFIDKHVFFDPLSELKKLLAVLPKSCELYVMGGFALDGHLGKLTRKHNDVDLICWRKDVNIFKKALKLIGYKVREKYDKDNPKLLILLETEEDNPAIEVKIIDKQPDNNFRFYFNTPGQQIFPKKMLGPVQVSLDGIKFPVIKLELIAELVKIGEQVLKRIKKENPKLYKVLGSKIINNKKDIELIDKLMVK
jgi:Aminoglycoside-2''-adenylyltransferase